ncbi:TPA: hypothetical protein DCW54_02820 [Candidatus Dependentiae bacterium]|nr:hypothetical protein [Candidatus Dependentiae bacterium]
MKHKNLITYALGVSLLICGYSVITHVTNFQTGVCHANQGQNNFQESAPFTIEELAEIIKNGCLAQKEIFLGSFLVAFNNATRRSLAGKGYLENLNELRRLGEIDTEKLAADLQETFKKNNIEIAKELLVYRLTEMKLFEAFNLFLSLRPEESPYTWGQIRKELCDALKNINSVPRSLADEQYTQYKKLLTTLQNLSDTSNRLMIGVKLYSFGKLLPQSVQKRCTGLGSYIKY